MVSTSDTSSSTEAPDLGPSSADPPIATDAESIHVVASQLSKVEGSAAAVASNSVDNSESFGMDAPLFEEVAWQFMSLREPPFADDVGDNYFFPSHQHIRAMSFIGQLLWSRANIAVITGDRGIGKTFLIRRLLGDLDERILLAHVESTANDPNVFLRDVLRQFGMELGDSDKTDRRKLLTRFFLHQYGQNRICTLVVDDVHALRPAVLEELRLIAGLTVDDKRVVKMLMLGGPVLNHIIDAPRMAGVSVGRAPRLHIESFSEDQVAAYVMHRLRAAGAADPDALAPPKLFPHLHRYTGGIPRSINLLCENAMAIAASVGVKRITEQALTRAAETLHFIPSAERLEAIANSGPESSFDQQALLLVSVQGFEDSVVPLNSTRLLIGRSESADIRIDSAFVSRYHTLIVREAGVDLLIDLGSTNGVLVNGKRAVRAALKHRDLIQVGPARVTYLNPAIAPRVEADGSETLRFAKPKSADDASEGGVVMSFGRFDEAG